jgi:hypothetical protein
MTGPFCLGCEQFPGLRHRHEWFDRETLQPAAAPVVSLPTLDKTPRLASRGVRDADAA